MTATPSVDPAAPSRLVAAWNTPGRPSAATTATFPRSHI
jgi:hypothetical protein